MRLFRRQFLIVGFLLSTMHFFAQKIDPDDSFTFELCLPNSFVNKPYKTIMQGLVSASPYYQYSLKSGISFGVGVHYSYFAINEFRMPVKVFGGIHTGAAFLKLGHEKFWTERFGTDIGCKFGYLQSFAVSDLLRSQGNLFNQTEALFLEPTIGFVLTADVNSSYRLTVGYPIYGYTFTPWTIGYDSTLGYSESEFSKTSSFLNVGFAYTFYFNGKKSSAED
ncbi:MAG: hypothetical protein ACOVNZ_09735 [Crocinitomicaceae bacterium]|jgi:hypothetical protein